MSYATNLVFYHTGTAEQEDYPGTMTITYPNSDAPTVTGGELVFDGANEAIRFDFGSGVWAVGTGNWTIAIKFRYPSSFGSARDAIIHIGNETGFYDELIVGVYDTVVGRFGCWKEYAPTSHRIYGDIISTATTYTRIVTRNGNTVYIYDDSGNDLSNVRAGDFSDPTTALDLTTEQFITLGSQYSGSNTAPVNIDWVAVWDRALDPGTELNGISESAILADLAPSGFQSAWAFNSNRILQ